MRVSLNLRKACISAGVILLAGCGGGAVSPNSSSALPQASRQISSIAPQAQEQDLLYVTDSGYSVIDVYTYPGARLVNSFGTGASGFPLGLCVDTQQNVYVTSTYGDISEYRHGGTQAIHEWNNFSSPNGCSVDPTTGNLAVADYEANLSGGHGDVWILNTATGKGHSYSARAFTSPYWCGYDPQGNLFAEGLIGHGPAALYELPKGGSTLKKISIPVNGSPSGVQWDGKYMTIGLDDTIYRLQISGAKAKVVGSTTLSDYSGFSWGMQNYFVVSRNNKQGTRLAATSVNSAGIFYYTAGGQPIKVVKLHSTTSAVVSFAKN